MMYAHYVLKQNELCVAYIRFSETETETATVTDTDTESLTLTQHINC